MKNTLTRPMAAAGASVLAAVLLTGCGATSAPTASGSPTSAGSTTSATASAKAAVPAAGAVDSGEVTSTPNKFFNGSAKLESFRIGVKRTVDAQGSAVLSVTADPKLVDWVFNGAGLSRAFYVDRITQDQVSVKDSMGQELKRSSTTPGAFVVPAGSDTDTVKVSLVFEDEAKTTVQGYVPADTSAPGMASERFEINDVPVTLTPEAK